MGARDGSAEVAVVGAGHIGLPLAVWLARQGLRVTCVESSRNRLALLRRAQSPILEPGVGEALKDLMAEGNLFFYPSLGSAPGGPWDAVFVCVGFDKRKPLGGLSPLLAVARERLAESGVIFLRTTLPVGVSALLEKVARPGLLAYWPEFLREGSALRDLDSPSVVLIGAETTGAAEKAYGWVRDCLRFSGRPRVLLRTFEEAALIKCSVNAYLGLRLSFANEVASLAHAMGLNPASVIEGLAADPRVGTEYFRPGPGWGGSCLPKDSHYLDEAILEVLGHPSIARASLVSNARRMRYVVRAIVEAAKEAGGARVAVWGLAFKAGTNDLRSSPAVAVVRGVRRAGLEVRAFDPAFTGATEDGPLVRELMGARVVEDPIECCRGASVLGILTDWPAFSEVSLHEAAAVMDAPKVVDARSVLVAGLEGAGIEVVRVS